MLVATGTLAEATLVGVQAATGEPFLSQSTVYARF